VGARVQAPKGTFDVLPEQGAARLALLARCERTLGAAGYGPAETPVFEDTELFARGVGAATDIVRKEMFTFEDQGGRSLTLRPEGTAGVCRAYVEHGMHKLPQPVKLWYWGPFFRHEAPQAGRYRQFTQVGAEAIGSDDPSLDAELILLLAELLRESGVAGVRLRLASLASPEARADYLDELRAHLRARADELSEEVRERLELNPLRAFDSAHEGTRRVMADAPRLLDRLPPDDAEHFASVRALLDAAGQEYEVDATLVRGLDYYTRTVFEFTSDALGAQSGVGGGGRYDRLVEELGGERTPGVGWAAGVERILLAAGAPGAAAEPAAAAPRVDAYVARAPGADAVAAFALATRLRRQGASVRLEQAGRSLKGQLKQAGRLRARWTAIVGEEGVELRDMETGEQRPASADEVLAAVRAGA
jgi:histidyl-tRNA synthetase